VDASGGWTNWNGPWNSALKMHAAGDLELNGSLTFRGIQGYYSSSTLFQTVGLYEVSFGGLYCDIAVELNNYFANPLRCLKD
jgi:hypothetical protein